MSKCYKVKKKKNRDPKSTATSNFILIVVVMVTLKRSEVIFKLLQNFFERREIVSQSAVLKCRKAPYFYLLTFTVHKVYIVINFISFIDNVISLYSLSEAFMFVFLHDRIL